jgi:predicted pyridoxine 5'-phosphate oxidase superfamily flavin-nucleotide-binding protein
MDDIGRKVVRDHMPDQHRTFFAQLPFVVIGAVDEAGDAWATLRAGEPGFMQSPDPYTLALRLPAVPDDPADAGLADGDAVGLLGIELHTRRRNRMNGRLRRGAGDYARIAVQESFGNCPQYIHVRQWEAAGAAPDAPRWSDELDADAIALIRAAGTFFVASYADTEKGRRVDVSHRGGAPGFVTVADDGSLLVPDYSGNRFFNTLGNLLVNGRAGLVFPDFAHGHLLQLTGDVEVMPADVALAPGAERMWRFRPRRAVWRAGALPLRWMDR